MPARAHPQRPCEDTLARALLEAVNVEYLDVPTMVADEAGFLQGTGNKRDARRSAHEHLASDTPIAINRIHGPR